MKKISILILVYFAADLRSRDINRSLVYTILLSYESESDI